MSDNKVIIHKGRTCTLEVHLGIDVADDALTSQIRTDPEVTSPLLATWVVGFKTDGHDGKLVLTLSHTVTGGVTAKSGYMDVKRVTGGVPVPCFDEPVEVAFRGVATE